MKLRAEPESLDEHGHHDELSDARGRSPDPVQPLCGDFEADKRVLGTFVLHLGGVERLDGGNGVVDNGSRDSGLFVGEEWASEALGKGLDEHKERHGGEDDEGEGPGSQEGENKTSYASRQMV